VLRGDWADGWTLVALFGVTTALVVAVWVAGKRFLKARPSRTSYESALTAPPLDVKKPSGWFWNVSCGLEALGGIAAVCLFAWHYYGLNEVHAPSFYAALVLGLPVFLVEQLEDESPASPVVRRTLTIIWKIACAFVWVEGFVLAAVAGYFAWTWGSELIASLSLRAIGIIIIVLMVVLIVQLSERGRH
jgi:hypothetical protein